MNGFPYCKHVTHTETAISFTKDTKTAMLYKAATEWREMLYLPYNLCPFILDIHGGVCNIIILLIMLHMCPVYFRIVLGFVYLSLFLLYCLLLPLVCPISVLVGTCVSF